MSDVTESHIRDQIYEYLQKRRIFVWKDQQPTGKIQKGSRRSKGVADLLGIYRGSPLAIEVKQPHGVLSQAQWKWLTEFKRHGGIAMVASSVEAVQQALADVEQEKPRRVLE